MFQGRDKKLRAVSSSSSSSSFSRVKYGKVAGSVLLSYLSPIAATLQDDWAGIKREICHMKASGQASEWDIIKWEL